MIKETAENKTPILCDESLEKPYEFRKLGAPDMFIMCRIISKIGVNEFTACFEKDGIKNLLASVTGEDGKEDIPSIVGISVIFEIANVILGNLPKCESEIYQILAQTSNQPIENIKSMDMVTFFEMVVDFIKKEEFRDFIKAVSRLLK